MNKIEKIEYFTAQRVNISELVKKGFTTLFDTEKDAWSFARRKGSYVYPVYDKKEFLINYAVSR